jgi:hypothetical protein
MKSGVFQHRPEVAPVVRHERERTFEEPRPSRRMTRGSAVDSPSVVITASLIYNTLRL